MTVPSLQLVYCDAVTSGDLLCRRSLVNKRYELAQCVLIGLMENGLERL
jgi:hypothetical protein